MATSRRATAVWQGTGLQGTGTLNTANKFFNNTPYSFKTRVESEAGAAGTNPEELLAAAHASCFAMALSFAIVQAGFVADELKVEAKVTLDTVDGGFGVTGIVLQLAGRVAGMGEAQFLELANGAKAGCPISKALGAVPIHLDATFAA
ncbi:OsmC family protein [Hymenobacter sp. ASUV-10]|uniref:OsmC family protein n=1 Tax=Hymenobacter aranciens TaxID=3063996 RepID=A0ABT9BAV3_9BACT|nr:OsmC family protein [Hymenobacter sp. ASUV-10]MDO7875392.1 OsmC family protein [Hymenobacter sp. ASUV-10]